MRERFETFLRENPGVAGVANIQSEADKGALFRQFQAWDNARAQVGSQEDSKKVRDKAR